MSVSTYGSGHTFLPGGIVGPKHRAAGDANLRAYPWCSHVGFSRGPLSQPCSRGCNGFVPKHRKDVAA